MKLSDLHQSSLKDDTDLGKKEVDWWFNVGDRSNVENIRTYLNMITTEHELIKLYTAKSNKNTENRLVRLIQLNNDLVHFFLTYVNKLYWLSSLNGEPQEKSGLTNWQKFKAFITPCCLKIEKDLEPVLEDLAKQGLKEGGEALEKIIESKIGGSVGEIVGKTTNTIINDTGNSLVHVVENVTHNVLIGELHDVPL
jgi:hypothetical protein